MSNRWFAALAALGLVAAPAAGQAQTAAAKTAKPAAKTWTVPKTPWGDPDIQGVWTSDSVRGIPTQRPAELAGKAELTEEEFKAKVERDTKTRTTAENAEGAFRNDGAWLVKSFRQTSLITDPADGRFPPLTADAQKRAAPRDRGSFGEGPFEGPEAFTLYDRCITRGIVGSILPVVYGNGNRILQTPGQVVISYEMVHDTRVIPLDGRPHIGSKIRQYLGDSRGHWEGNTLVVETTNLTDQTSIGANGNGLRHSADMKIVERFTRTEADVLKYDVTVDDPKTYTRPFTISIPLISPAGFQLLPYECHEGNYMLAAVLGGERAEDRALEEDAKKGIIRPRKGVQQGLDAGARPIPATEGGEGAPAR
uniref:Uncharacterized protein n=1 Tax=uncultured Acidobacteria bacterium A3 TaxID=1036853 RepID=F8TTI9_9BACT|nr:hypothetical protein [uncultured Acidobacteria bacterium A3]